MKTVEGYLASITTEERYFNDYDLEVCDEEYHRVRWYGKGSRSGHNWENFITNNLQTFTLDEAQGILPRLIDVYSAMQEKVINSGIANVKLEISETLDEIYSMEGRDKLIVLGYGEMEVSFLGKGIPCRPRLGYIPGSYIWDNNLTSFDNYESAMYCLGELGRQGGMKARLANLEYQIMNNE